MELPFNTTISKDLLKGTRLFAEPVVNWSTKRRWVQEAFEALERAGYHVGSAYTAVKDPSRTKFVYRDRLWQGADMAGLGVASFGHVNGVHMQNKDTWETYSEASTAASCRCSRAYRPTHEERMIRELVLQLKLGQRAPVVLRRQVRRRHPRALPRPVRVALEARATCAEPSDDDRGADARRPAARRLAAAALLPPEHAASATRNGRTSRRQRS